MKISEENTLESTYAIPRGAVQTPATGGTATIMDNRTTAVYQRRLQNTMNNDKATRAITLQQKTSAEFSQKNDTGLPNQLKTNIEHLSGYRMDDVKVYYNSHKPTQLRAHAYAQGTDIHLAPGQEKHLPHEAWHVVQQKQGRVKPTLQMKGAVNVNNDRNLEREADIMGEKAMHQGSVRNEDVFPSYLSLEKPSSNMSTIQRVDFDDLIDDINMPRADRAITFYNGSRNVRQLDTRNFSNLLRADKKKFINCDFSQVDFSRVPRGLLTGVQFEDCQFDQISNTNFSSNVLLSCRFNGQITNTNFLDTSFDSCNFMGRVSFTNTNFTGVVKMRDCEFDPAVNFTTPTSFLNADLDEYSLGFLLWSDVVGVPALRLNINLQGFDLRKGITPTRQGLRFLIGSLFFRNANRVHDILSGVDLSNANLEGLSMKRVNLGRANLSDANLREVNLRGANLRGANLTRANLTGVNLTSTDLTGANLTRANFSGAIFSSIVINRQSVMRRGQVMARGGPSIELDLNRFQGATLSLADFRNALMLHGNNTRNIDLNSVYLLRMRGARA